MICWHLLWEHLNRAIHVIHHSWSNIKRIQACLLVCEPCIRVCLGNLCPALETTMGGRRASYPGTSPIDHQPLPPHWAQPCAPHSWGQRGRHTEGRSTIQGTQPSNPNSSSAFALPPQTPCSNVDWWGTLLGWINTSGRYLIIHLFVLFLCRF